MTRAEWYALLNKTPGDKELRSVYADWLEDRGDVEGAAAERQLIERMGQHEWHDVSYHGSPDYECKFCHVDRNSKAAAGYCQPSEHYLHEIAKGAEYADWFEYQALLQRQAREAYLRRKYENGR